MPAPRVFETRCSFVGQSRTRFSLSGRPKVASTRPSNRAAQAGAVIRTDLAILFGAAATIATCIGFGWLWLSLLRVRLLRAERWTLSFLCGSAVLSGILFLLCCLHGAHRGVFSTVAIAAIAGAGVAAFRNRRKPEPFSNPHRLPRWWGVAFTLVAAVFGVLYFFNAMTPDTSPDGTCYHLWLAQTYLRAHGFVRLDSFFANMPQGLEVLFVFALAFGRNSSASLVHFAFLMALPLLMVSYGRRAGCPIAAAAAALFVFVSPVVGVDGTTAYNDIAATTLVFAVFHLMRMWAAERRMALLATAGALAGFAYSIKYTAALVIVFALGAAARTLWQDRQPWLRPIFAFCLCASIFIVPWTLKSWIWAGNPVPPFANRLFPNPNVHITLEDELQRTLRRYDLKGPSEIPVELMLHGGSLGGILGPLFFAAPLALLALRRPQGRGILLAAAVLLLPYFNNIGTRFVLPALPFISLAMALGLTWIWTAAPALLLALAITSAVACWPSTVALYAPSGIWRIPGFQFRKALRLEPEDVWLSREFPPYLVARMVEQFVPAGQKVFGFALPARSYSNREITVSFESAPGEVRRDVLLTPLIKDWHPTRVAEFAFTPVALRKIRLVQTAASPSALWSVSELRAYSRGAELPRLPSWRLTAQPNPWDVRLAFDNLAVTRWRSWRAAAPGMYLEVDFGQTTSVDCVRVQSAPDEFETKCRIDGMRPGDKGWTVLSEQPKQFVDRRLDDVNLRGEATYVLKNQGFRYLLIENDSLGAGDYLRRAYFWNIVLQADRAGSRLYKILP